MIALMMGTEMVPETLDINELTRLSAREEFINFSRRESFTSYKTLNADSDGKVYHYTHCCQHHSQHENGIYFSAFNSYNFHINIL
jgi:hypothetical protein